MSFFLPIPPPITESSVLASVYEEEGLAQVPLIRGPGTFGELRLQYTVLNGTARSGADFLVPRGEVVLPSGVGKTSINVTIVDDTLREFAEQFEVRLTPGGLSGKLIEALPRGKPGYL